MEYYIQYDRLDELEANPDNPKMHDLSAIQESIDRFGYGVPIVVDERTGLLAAGHGRVEGLLTKFLDKDELPEGCRTDDDGMWLVPVQHGWYSANDDEAKAFMVAANQTSIIGGWDEKVLAELLNKLDEAGVELSGTGFIPADVDELLKRRKEFNPNRGEPGAQVEADYDQRRAQYEGTDLRGLVFDYTVAEYEQIIERCTILRTRYGVDTNAELFIEMLREWDNANPEGENASED